MSTATRTLTFIGLALVGGLAWLAAGDAGAQSTERLGKVNLPTTCAAVLTTVVDNVVFGA